MIDKDTIRIIAVFVPGKKQGPMISLEHSIDLLIKRLTVLLRTTLLTSLQV